MLAAGRTPSDAVDGEEHGPLPDVEGAGAHERSAGHRPGALRRRLRSATPPVAVLAGLAAVAEIVTRLDGDETIPSPSATASALVRGITSRDLVEPLLETLDAYGRGLAVAVVLGLVAGVLVGVSRVFDAATSVVVEALRPLPAVAFIPVVIMVFGLGRPARTFVAGYAAVWPVLISTTYGVRSVEPLLVDVARSSGLGRLARLRRVVVPAALPRAVTGIRTAASFALLAVVTAELVIGNAGLGGYMSRQQLASRTPELYAAIVLVGLVGLAVNTVTGLVARRAVFSVHLDEPDR